MKKYLKKKKASVVRHLKAGMSYRKLALTIVLGIAVGLMPVIGITTIICFFMAYIFRLNHLIIQAAQFTAFPLQLLLIVPFYKIGHLLFWKGEAFFTRTHIKNIFIHAFTETSWNFFMDTISAVGAWFLIAIVPSVVSYFVLCYIFKRLNINTEN